MHVRIRPKKLALVMVAAVAIFAIALLGFSSENDQDNRANGQGPDDAVANDDTTDQANSNDATAAIGMPNVTKMLPVDSTAMVPEDANAIAEKVAGRNTEMTTCDQVCDANRYIMNETALLMRPTKMYFGRTDDGRRSNAPPMNDALALILTMHSSTTTSMVSNC